MRHTGHNRMNDQARTKENTQRKRTFNSTWPSADGTRWSGASILLPINSFEVVFIANLVTSPNQWSTCVYDSCKQRETSYSYGHTRLARFQFANHADVDDTRFGSGKHDLMMSPSIGAGGIQENNDTHDRTNTTQDKPCSSHHTP